MTKKELQRLKLHVDEIYYVMKSSPTIWYDDFIAITDQLDSIDRLIKRLEETDEK